MGILRQLLLWGSENRWLSRNLPRYAFVRRAIQRFMPGEELSEALEAALQLQQIGITSLLSLLGENIVDEEDSVSVVQHYLRAMDEARATGLDTELSLKLTHLGLDLSHQLARGHLEQLLQRAQQTDDRVWIDMEGSAYTDITLEIFEDVCQRYQNVGICLQSYLRRTADDLEAILPFAPAIRLVKGAYAEPPSVAFANKADVDNNFVELVLRMFRDETLRTGLGLGIATHDVGLIGRIQRHAERRGVSRSAYEFQMLYGIRRQDQQRLAADGYRMRVLISYGEAWFAWYMRRLAERPANVWFVVRNLVAS